MSSSNNSSSNQPPNNSTNRNNHENPNQRLKLRHPKGIPTHNHLRPSRFGQLRPHHPTPNPRPHPRRRPFPGGTEVLRRQITTTTRSPGGRVLQETRTIYPPTSTPNNPTTPNTSAPAPASASTSTSTHPPDSDSEFIIYNDTGEMYFDLRDFIGDTLAPEQRITAICRACHGFILEDMVHQCPAVNVRAGSGKFGGGGGARRREARWHTTPAAGSIMWVWWP